MSFFERCLKQLNNQCLKVYLFTQPKGLILGDYYIL